MKWHRHLLKYDQIDEVFEDEAVDIIYITSPHNTHYEFMKKALEHGKHILVEKSITLNSRELDEMIALAAVEQAICIIIIGGILGNAGNRLF